MLAYTFVVFVFEIMIDFGHYEKLTKEKETKIFVWVKLKAIGTKAPFNGGFAFAWLSTKLCARLQRPDLFMNRPAIKFLILGRAS